MPTRTQAGGVPHQPGESKGQSTQLTAAEFRVEEFRLPVFARQYRARRRRGRRWSTPQPCPWRCRWPMCQGGPAARLPVQRVGPGARQGAQLCRPRTLFSFHPPRPTTREASATPDDEEDTTAARRDQRVVADKRALVLDRQWRGASCSIDASCPPSRPARAAAGSQLRRPQRRDSDPAQRGTCCGPPAWWPASSAEGWCRPAGAAACRRIALDAQGKPAGRCAAGSARAGTHRDQQPQAHGRRLLQPTTTRPNT
jgi:hypothetical protein